LFGLRSFCSFLPGVFPSFLSFFIYYFMTYQSGPGPYEIIFSPFLPYQARNGIGSKIDFQWVSNKYMPQIGVTTMVSLANHKYS
jgi:hypothetical protein